MTATCDEKLRVYFDGVLDTTLPESELDDWSVSSTFNVPVGAQEVGIECENTAGWGGILASFDNGRVTDGTHWECSSESFDTGMAPATVIGNNGECWKYFPSISSNAQWIWTPDYQSKSKVFCKGIISKLSFQLSSPGIDINF